MQMLIEKMLTDFERGRLTRRQLAATLGGMAAAAAMPMAPALAAPSLKAITLNHVTVRVPNLQKTSKFYQDFFGMKLAQQSETIHILSVGESFFGIEQTHVSDCVLLVVRCQRRLVWRSVCHFGSERRHTGNSYRL